MVTLVSGGELLQQGGEAALLQPLVPANTAVLSPWWHQEPSHRSRERRTGPRSPSWPFPLRQQQRHSPFQVGSNPHVGHLPAHSCNGREDNQALRQHQRQDIALGAGLRGEQAGGQGWGFSSSFCRPEGGKGLRESDGRSLYLPCQSQGCFHLSTGRPNAGRCSI